MALIAHIAILDDWESARNLGEYEVSTRGVSLAEAGFIHAVVLDGIRRVLADYYADVRFALLLVLIDTDSLEADGLTLTEEVPGLPHLHGGPLPTDGAAVVATLPIERDAGAFLVPDLTPYGGAAGR